MYVFTYVCMKRTCRVHDDCRAVQAPWTLESKKLPRVRGGSYAGPLLKKLWQTTLSYKQKSTEAEGDRPKNRNDIDNV